MLVAHAPYCPPDADIGQQPSTSDPLGTSPFALVTDPSGHAPRPLMMETDARL